MFNRKGNDDDELTTGQDATDRSRASARPEEVSQPPTIATPDTFPPKWTFPRTAPRQGASVEVPDLVGEVIGFRYFDCTTSRVQSPQLHGGAMEIPTDDGLLTTQYRSRKIGDLANHRLVSPYRQYTWDKGYDTAPKMNAQEGGFYAYHDVSIMGGFGHKARVQYSGAMWKIPAVMQARGEKSTCMR